MMKKNSLTSSLHFLKTLIFVCYFLTVVRCGRSADEIVDDKIYYDIDLSEILSTEFFTEWDVYPQNGMKEKDKIASLPGQEKPVNFTQYGGYVTIDEKTKSFIYYYLVEADAPNASSLPLLLWLNGGPACSALLGAFEEVGPFRILSDGKTLMTNPYAWNKEANVLFMEYPAGIGFSYWEKTSEYLKTGDKKTARDGYRFLVNWFERFPEYKRRDFYIAGESYAGHYVSQLSGLIHRFNNRPGSHFINLKGIAIGNGLLNQVTDAKGFYEYRWTHGLISKEVLDDIDKNCDFNVDFNFVMIKTDEPKCNASITKSVVLGIENFNIYASGCVDNSITEKPRRTPIEDPPEPCVHDFLTAYLNQAVVREAMHAKADMEWSMCSLAHMPYHWRDSPKTILPIVKELMASGIRVLVYNGDLDARVPFTSSKYSIDLLNLTVKTPWSPWIAEKEVGGFSVAYENLTFATIRGAGHQAPADQPIRALELIKNFLRGIPFSSA